MNGHCQFVVMVGQAKAGASCYWGEVESRPFPKDFQMPDSKSEEIEKRQMEIRKEGKMEDELMKLQAKMENQQSKIKELKEMHVHTNNLIAEIKSSLQQAKQ